MNNEKFNTVVKYMMNKCGNVLMRKGKEYAGENSDRLVSFKRAAGLTGETPTKVALSYMCKHVVSVYDLAERGVTDAALWDEKLGDLINYCILTRALIAEENGENLEAATGKGKMPELEGAVANEKK